MHWLRVVGILVVVALLQVTFLPVLEVRGVHPDLLLLVAVYVVVREPLRKGWIAHAFWLGWVAGLMEDVYSAGSHLPLGSTALVFGLMAVVMARLGAELYFDSAISQVLVVGPACLAAHGVLGLALMMATGGPAGPILARALWTAVYSALAAPLVCLVLRRLERPLGVRSRRSFGDA